MSNQYKNYESGAEYQRIWKQQRRQAKKQRFKDLVEYAKSIKEDIRIAQQNGRKELEKPVKKQLPRRKWILGVD